MGFDDLARHMASRDGKKAKVGQPGDVNTFIAENEEHDRKLQRKRDLILGPVMLVGGAVLLTFIGLYLIDALDPKPNPLRPPEQGNTIWVPTGIAALSAGAVIDGLRRIVRGFRGRARSD